jgi:hypothetical protein
MTTGKTLERYIAERPLRLFIPKSKIKEYEANGWAVRPASQAEIDAEFAKAAQVRIKQKG